MADPNSEKSKTCFVIGPIGEDGSDTRHQSDWFLTLVREVLENEPFDYSVTRADEGGSGSITLQIMSDVIDSDLVVADLTGHNANVFYELAIRHTIDKDFVLMASPGTRPPFDTQDLRVISYTNRSPSEWVKAKTDLAAHVSRIEGGKKPTNPITMAKSIQQLEHSNDPVQESLASLITEVSALRGRLGRLEDPVMPFADELRSTSVDHFNSARSLFAANEEALRRARRARHGIVEATPGKPHQSDEERAFHEWVDRDARGENDYMED